MVRRHSAWARSRMKRSRPKTPAPQNGWVIHDLSRISGIPVRRLRDYVFRDLIAPLERRGTATRYARGQLVRLMAIKRLRAEAGLKLSEIKRHMDAKGERELEDWILTGPLPEAVLQALGRLPGDTTIQQAQAAPSPPLPIPSRAQGWPAQSWSAVVNATPVQEVNPPWLVTWHHVELLPGLVLQLSATASPAVKSAAKRIWDEYTPR